MKSVLLALVLAAGCGSVKGPATPTDAPAIDADLTDADLTGMLSVVTQTESAASAGSGATVGSAQGMVDIVALAPNGVVTDALQTDATGHAQVKAYPGGSVTAIYRHTADSGADLVTFMGVKPNDTLTFGAYWSPTDNTPVGSMTLSWPAFPGATQYNLYTPCNGFGFGSGTTSFAISEIASCHHDPMGVITVAFDMNGVAAMGYSIVNFQNGGTAGLTGWQTAQPATASLTGLPPEVSNVFMNFSAVFNGGRLTFAEGAPSAQPTGGAATMMLNWASVGDRTVSQISLSRQGPYPSITVLDGLNPNARSVTVASPQLPPWVAGRIASTAARMAAWFPIGMPTHDGNVVIVNWFHTVMGATTASSWTFITPPEVSAFTFPALPSQFDDIEPHPEDGNNSQLHLLEIPTVNGYDDLRKLPAAAIACPTCAVANNVVQRIIESD